MNREELDKRNTSAIKFHLRQLNDQFAAALPAYLADLARIADEHAGDCTRAFAGQHKASPAPVVVAANTEAVITLADAPTWQVPEGVAQVRDEAWKASPDPDAGVPLGPASARRTRTRTRGNSG